LNPKKQKRSENIYIFGITVDEYEREMKLRDGYNYKKKIFDAERGGEYAGNK
jgi:hypothetical protein